jgi:hypothetical protein
MSLALECDLPKLEAAAGGSWTRNGLPDTTKDTATTQKRGLMKLILTVTKKCLVIKHLIQEAINLTQQ